MLDSILIGMAGLDGYSRGLRVIANNTANINTPGYKSSSLQFADMFYTNDGAYNQYGQLGNGLTATRTIFSFKQGELHQTGNDLDVAVDGNGLFMLKQADGSITYTRAGQFQFNKDGILVNSSDGAKVMGIDADGKLTEITTTGSKSSTAKATSTILFDGNLANASATETVGGLTVYDAVGGSHTLSVKLTNTNAATPGSWKVELMDGATVVGTGQIIFQSGKPQTGNSKVNITYSPTGVDPVPLTLDFSTDVTSSANATSLAMTSQDGYGQGSLSKLAFDDKGALALTYSNGQTVKGAKLALAYFDTADAIQAVGNNQFKAIDSRAWHTGTAGNGAFGSVHSGVVELSNVDLSQEFGNLIIMQRGYQASSQIISTANEMLQELFAMKGK